MHSIAEFAQAREGDHDRASGVPSREDGLGRAVGEAHRRYMNFIYARGRWTGHLFQGRFASVAMDEPHLLAAVFYVSLNPVRVGLVRHTADWAWSSVRARLAVKDDALVAVRPVLDRVACFSDPQLEDRDEVYAALRGKYGPAGRDCAVYDRTGAGAWTANCAACSRTGTSCEYSCRTAETFRVGFRGYD